MIDSRAGWMDIHLETAGNSDQVIREDVYGTLCFHNSSLLPRCWNDR